MAPTALLQGGRAVAYAALAGRLLEVARAGAQFPDAGAFAHLFSALGRVAPRHSEAKVELVTATGLPSARSLERLSVLRDTAVAYLEAHGARPQPDARAFLTALAARPLPAAKSTSARMVSKSRSGGRFQVVHDRYVGAQACPTRFVFHLTDARQRYLATGKDAGAVATKALLEAIDLACEGGAEEALWGLASLPGAEVSEVVMGQLGPLEAPGFGTAPALPLTGFLKGAGAGDGGVLHLVLERAATDVAQDNCRDPFGAVSTDGQRELRRAGLRYRVARERRLACSPALEAKLVAHFAGLGSPLVVRSR